MRGSLYCYFHGGRGRKHRSKSYGPRGHVKAEMAAYYSRSVSPLLRQKLEELAAMSPEERYGINEEIDIARQLSMRALALFDAAHYPPDGKEVSLETRITAQSALRSALNFVGELVLKGSRARALNESSVDADQLAYITDQVTIIIEEEIADVDRAMADRVVERIRGIKMPTRKGVGAALTPDEMARSLRAAANALDAGMDAGMDAEMVGTDTDAAGDTASNTSAGDLTGSTQGTDSQADSPALRSEPGHGT